MMGWLPGAKVGDKFRWLRDGTVCRITEFRDHGVEVCFVHETGPRKGQWGYTVLPQDVELMTVLDELAGI